MTERARVRIVVLDGVDWEYVFDRHEAMPTLWRIAEEGCCAPLEACKAPVTSDAVAALLTGRDVEMHFVTDDRYTNSQELVRNMPWFGELARNGMSLSLCNVPLTWPAFRVPGPGSWMTSGYPVGSESRWSWGPAPVDGYPLGALLLDSRGGPGGSKDLGAMSDGDHNIVSRFLAGPRCAVEVIWLRSSDCAGHHAWGTPEYDRVVMTLDLELQRLREGCDTLLVISDHGFDSVDSQRCDRYMATNHGPTTRAAKLSGGHTMDGILFAAGDDIHVRGVLRRQKLLEVAGGLFDVLGIPPAPGMISNAPTWARATSDGEEERMRQQLKALGYTE